MSEARSPQELRAFAHWIAEPYSWVDHQGGLHFEIPAMLAQLGLEDTPENREAVSKVALAETRALLPRAAIVRD